MALKGGADGLAAHAIPQTQSVVCRAGNEAPSVRAEGH